MDHPILTQAKILTILKKKEATEDVILLDVDVKCGSEKGQNYSGQVLESSIKAKVNGNVKSYHWMTKIPQANPDQFMWGRQMHMEEKEVAFYHDLVPGFQQMIEKREAKIELNFCPSLHAEFDPNVAKEECEKGSMLVMDHMGQFGYEDAIDKRAGLNLDHVKLVLPELAKFHAVSYAFLKEKHGSLDNMLKKEPLMGRDFLFSSPEEAMMEFGKTFDKTVIDLVLDTLTYCGLEYRKSFQKHLDEGGDPILLRNTLYMPSEYKFNTLCHGDSWFNNMMFRYDKQNGKPKPTKVCLLDMAILRWSSPTTDLAYFFYLCTTPELRKTHLNELLEHYHQHLSGYLRELGENPSVIPLDELKADYQKASFTGFMMVLSFSPWILAPKEDAMGVEDFSGDFMDEAAIAEMSKTTKKVLDKVAQKCPNIVERWQGAFLEMVELGHFKL